MFYPFIFSGKNDLRVPPSQGYEFYNALKVRDSIASWYIMSTVFQARGKEVFMNTYDDNHPLAKVENDVNVMINAAVFFNNCLDA